MRGDGRFYQDERGYWVAVVNLPPAADGTRRRKTIRRKDRAEVTRERRKLLGELAQHGDTITSTPTMREYLTRWLDDTAAHRLRPRTLTTYRGYVERWIIPAVGNVRVQDMTPRHVQAVHALCRKGYGEEPDRRDPVSSTTALQVHRILAVALRDAVRAGHLRTNPADRDHVEAPRKAVGGGAVLTPEQAMKVLHVAAKDPKTCARWALALLAGLRQGEALGLERSQVDLTRGTLTVQWQLQRLKADPPAHEDFRALGGGYYLTRPKTSAGLRVIPLVGVLRDVLAAHIAQMPPAAGPHDLLFRRDGHHPCNPTVDHRAWKDLLARAEVPTVRLHDARHTTATLLLRAGVDAHVVQQIMGHSSIAQSRAYQHADLTMATDALERMGRLLSA